MSIRKHTVQQQSRSNVVRTVDADGSGPPLRVVDGGDSDSTDSEPLLSSKLYKDWYHRVGSGGPNDYIIAISANPRTTGVTGTGKTTLALRLAKTYFHICPDTEFNAENQTTLDPSRLSNEIYEESPPGAAMIYDEAQGTPDSTGLNSKRTMKEESLNTINNIATRRKERKTLIIVTQNIKSLVGDLYDYIDAWLLIHDDFDYWATHYGVNPDVFNFEQRKTSTPGHEDISWAPFPASDPDYAHLDKLKDEATKRGQQDEGEGEQELPKDVQAELAVAIKDAHDIGWRKVPDKSERLTFSGEYLRQTADDLGFETSANNNST